MNDIAPATWRRMVTVELVCWIFLTLGFLSAIPDAYQAVKAGPVEEPARSEQAVQDSPHDR